MAAVTVHSDFGAQKNKVCHCFCCFPIYLSWSDGTRCHDLHFLNVEFQASCFTLLFNFIKSLFSSSSLSAMRVVSSAYLTLVIFLLVILIPACALFSPIFSMMYSEQKLNKQGDNIQPWRTPFPIWNQSVVPYPVLLLPDLHICFSRCRSGGLVFPSLEEFFSVLWSTRSNALA